MLFNRFEVFLVNGLPCEVAEEDLCQPIANANPVPTVGSIGPENDSSPLALATHYGACEFSQESEGDEDLNKRTVHQLDAIRNGSPVSNPDVIRAYRIKSDSVVYHNWFTVPRL